MNKEGKRKLFKLTRNCLIIFFILLSILVTIYIVYINLPINRYLNYIYNENKENDIGKMPMDVSKLFVEYKGTVPQITIYKTMYSFVDKIIEKYYLETNNLNEEQLNEYYSKNRKNIEKEIGISELNQFIKFLEPIKKLTGTELKLNNYTINSNTITRYATYTKFVLLVKYENNETIGFYLEILNSVDKEKTPINFRGEVEEKYLDYEYKPNDYQTPDVPLNGKVIDN